MDMDAGSATKTLPDRDTIAQAIYTAVVGVNYKPWKGHSEDRWNSAVEAADAVLAVLADQPTVAEVREQVARDIEAVLTLMGTDPKRADERWAYSDAAHIARGGAA